MSVRETNRRMRLRRTGTIPADTTVRHFDELAAETQAAVAALAGGPWTAPEPADLDDGDVVKFTDYFKIRARAEAAATTRVDPTRDNAEAKLFSLAGRRDGYG
jgi:hypothetical protein